MNAPIVGLDGCQTCGKRVPASVADELRLWGIDPPVCSMECATVACDRAWVEFQRSSERLRKVMERWLAQVAEETPS